MKSGSRYLIIIILFLIVIAGLSGCSLLAIPGQLLGGTFSMFGKLFSIFKAMPKPPWWVFI
ncbi:MAG: hypothetical protein KBD53_01065 [Candidatus Omnitrophica bacterium]|nr:hypothetical protein [Candidatus Omnitrophota bacterium]